MPFHRSDSTRRFAPSALRPAVIALCLLIPPALVPGTASAGDGCVKGAVNCANNTMGTLRTCTATVQCNGASSWDFNTTTNLNVVSCLPAATNAMSSPATFTLTARANVTSATDRRCGWSWQIPGRGPGGSILIETADGLPVELMDFRVEDGDEPEPDDEPAPAARN